MKRPRSKRRGNLRREAEQLAWLANGLAESGSHAEDRYWDHQLSRLIDTLLAESEEDTLNEALDHLHHGQSRGFDELADLIEARTECGLRDQPDLDTLLIATPILAWSRFRIPALTIPTAVLANLRVHLQAHILARDVHLSLADYLFSPDQLPQGYCPTADLAAALSRASLNNQELHIDTESLPESMQFLSDTRYLLAAISAPRGAPLFRWQEADGDRAKSLAQWREQGGACLAPLMAGCATEIVLPGAYFSASRGADRESRPYSIRASVAFLSTTLETPANGLRAILAPFYDQDLEEYRIGFTLRGKDQVVHGVAWPLLGAEDDPVDLPAQIEAVLRECGVTDILQLDHRLPVEYCDDCGSPLYPNAEGEAVHAEMPEESATQFPRHLH